MRKKLLSILIMCVLVALILGGCGEGSSNGGGTHVPPTTPTSTLTMLSITAGNVFIMKAGTDNWILGQVGMSLEPGDTIKTDPTSNAEITFFDGSTIELQAGTQIEIVSLDISADTGSTTITLEQTIGTTLSRVTKLLDPASSYEVETPTGVAAVRGSSMLVQVIADGITWVTNLEGEIWVTYNGAELQVPQGGTCIFGIGESAQLFQFPVIGGSPGGGPPPNSDIAITKIPDLTQAHEGDNITYTYTVTNPGNAPLSDVSVTDDKIEDVTYQSGDTNGDGKLDADETWVFTATHTITADDISPLVNNAAAAGTNSLSQIIVAWTNASVDILRPAIAMNKTAEPVQAHEGDTIAYTYTITNPGNTPLSNILVTDDKAGNITYEGGYQGGDTNGDEILDGNETWVLIATYNVTADDVSPLVNTATVSGTDALGRSVQSEEAAASVDILRPAIAINKTAEPTEAYEGDTITYTYTITNPGNTPLSNIVVTDDKVGNITYGDGYQSGDTNGNEILDGNESWIFTATYNVTADDVSPLVNTATVSGTDALGRSVESEEDTASVDILQPVVVTVTFPDNGTAYIGYEDTTGGDFDYNDFGMSMFIEEVYVDDCLTEINMEFEAAVKLSGGTHDIHILRTLSNSTYYNYTITRNTAAHGTETLAVTNASGHGNFDIILFDDAPPFTSGAAVTIHIQITDGCESYNPTATPPRGDLASIWAYYDPYMYYHGATEHYIGDWQTAVSPLPSTGYDVPYILVIPVTDWQAPAEGHCITELYPYFDDYYHTGSPENWYEIKAS
jgi:uncharacterized repeat protein (TIGR01451 family)